MHLGPLVISITLNGKSQSMSEFPVSRDQIFNLYLAFEIELNILFL